MTRTSDIFSGFNLSTVADRERLLRVYRMWFERYPQDAKESLTQRLANGENALGAWFELLLHELLSRLGIRVEVIDIDNTDRTPDFLASHGYRSCYIEATTVNPRDNPSELDSNLVDALRMLNEMSSSDFQIRLIVNGRIRRPLSRNELNEKFGKMLRENDRDTVQKRMQEMGEWAAPSVEIKEEGWRLRGELVPISPEQQRVGKPQELIIGPVGTFSGDASPEVQKRVSNKAGKYGDLYVPLIVAANVIDVRFDREAEVAALFGAEQIRYFPNHPEIPDQLIRKPDGVWVRGGYKPRYTRLAGVIMFNGFLPWDPRGSVCVYVNPFGSNTEFPQPLYYLPQAVVEDRRLNWTKGIDVEILLATK